MVKGDIEEGVEGMVRLGDFGDSKRGKLSASDIAEVTGTASMPSCFY